MRFPILWFDLDDTLLDFSASSHPAFSALCKEIGLTEQEDSYSVYDRFNKVEWKLFEQGKITQEELKLSRFQNYFDHIGFQYDGYQANGIYLKYIAEFPVYVDGAEDLLNDINTAGFTSTIVTNGMKEVQRLRIQQCNWEHYFEHIFVSDEIGFAKPQIEFFDHCLQASGHPNKEDIIIIGDTLASDILGAKRAGISSCWINPDGKIHPPGIRPDYEIKALNELIDIIRHFGYTESGE